MHCFAARSLSRLLGPQLLSRTAPVAGTLVPKSTLMLTHPVQGRIYGPGEMLTSIYKQQDFSSVVLHQFAYKLKEHKPFNV